MADAAVDDLAVELDALRFQPRASGRNVADADRDPRRARRERPADARGIEDIERDLAERELDVVLVLRLDRKPQRLAVELLRPGDVLRENRDEVDSLDFEQAQPTEPSICSWISRFISTAYSSGSSLVMGSTKPDTISADASASERPRDIR